MAFKAESHNCEQVCEKATAMENEQNQIIYEIF